MRKFFKQYNQVEKKYFSINKVFLTICFLLALIQRIGYSEEMIESSKYIGTWIHRYDGSDSEAFAYNNKYAENILANGLPPGIIMIDDTWQDDYGKWVFDSERFYNPKSMIDRLHQLGFKVMLWICPFVSMDQYLICSNINAFNGFLRSKDGNPYPVRWWNGTSAVLDLSNPKSVEWFKGELDRLMKDYGIDGFKFDAGDFHFQERLQGQNNVHFSFNLLKNMNIMSLELDGKMQERP